MACGRSRKREGLWAISAVPVRWILSIDVIRSFSFPSPTRRAFSAFWLHNSQQRSNFLTKYFVLEIDILKLLFKRQIYLGKCVDH
jgi:hypothetical protein